MTTTIDNTPMRAAQFSSAEIAAELVRRGQADEVAARGGFRSVAAMLQWAVEDDDRNQQ